MKYEKLMQERGIKLMNLPKATQTKIEKLNLLIEDLNSLKSIPDEDIEVEDLEAIKEYEIEIEELDNHLERKVELFDPAKQAKILEKVQLMADLKKQKNVGRPKKVVEEVPKKEEPKQIDESATQALDYLSKMVPVENIVQENVQENVQEPVQEIVQERQPEPELEEDEDEEFAKVGEAKPKKVINKGWWIMGVGFVLLTWGAVNVFKERRG